MANFSKRPTPLRSDKFWLKAPGANGHSFDGLEEGMYAEAAKQGITFGMYLEQIKSTNQEKESPYLGLTPTEIFFKQKRLRDAGQEVPLTAVQECFKQAGVAAFGSRTDKVDKIYQYSDLDILFPDWISTRVHADLLLDSLVPEFTMGETVIDALTYEKIYLEDTEATRDLGEIEEGAEMGETKIIVGKQTIRLTKFGRYVTISDEAAMGMGLQVFGTAISRIGRQIDIRRTDRMFNVFKLGDGNSNTPATTVETAATGTIAVGDVISWSRGAPSPYKLDKFAGKKALLIEYDTTVAGMAYPSDQLNMASVQLPAAYEWDRTVMTADEFYGVDSRYALEHITTGSVMTETDRIIRRQINGTAISHRDAFSVFDNNACVIFDETHT